MILMAYVGFSTSLVLSLPSIFTFSTPSLQIDEETRGCPAERAVRRIDKRTHSKPGRCRVIGNLRFPSRRSRQAQLMEDQME